MLILSGLCACKPYRIEHHKRSPLYFNEQYVEGEVVYETTLEDGTVVLFEPIEAKSTFGRTGPDKRKPFRIREESEDGTITLRALLPVHVLVNLLNCLRAEEYELIYDQLLTEETREAFEADEGYDGYLRYMRTNRMDLTRLLTRMIAGLPQQHVKFTKFDPNITRCRLRRQFAYQFRFKRIDIVRESNGEYRLLKVG